MSENKGSNFCPEKCAKCPREEIGRALLFSDHVTIATVSSKKMCGALCEFGFVCTRPKNHKGVHEAAGIDDACAVWK